MLECRFKSRSGLEYSGFMWHFLKPHIHTHTWMKRVYVCVLFIGIVQRSWACLTWKSAIEIKSLLLLSSQSGVFSGYSNYPPPHPPPIHPPPPPWLHQLMISASKIKRETKCGSNSVKFNSWAVIPHGPWHEPPMCCTWFACNRPLATWVNM